MDFLTDSFIYLMETLLCLSYSSCKLYRADNAECSGSKWLCSLRTKTVHSQWLKLGSTVPLRNKMAPDMEADSHQGG